MTIITTCNTNKYKYIILVNAHSKLTFYNIYKYMYSKYQASNVFFFYSYGFLWKAENFLFLVLKIWSSTCTWKCPLYLSVVYEKPNKYHVLLTALYYMLNMVSLMLFVTDTESSSLIFFNSIIIVLDVFERWNNFILISNNTK